MKKSLLEFLEQDSYQGYAYAYPHKTSYRPLDPPVSLEKLWAGEDKDNLFLYVHLPFCEMRCGFCNLFTTVNPKANFINETLDAIKRQSRVVSQAIAPRRIAKAAFGGGTPSFLGTDELKSLFDRLNEFWPVDWGSIPVSFEISPGTVNKEKLIFLKEAGIDRISMGVQSFVRDDLKALGRPWKEGEVENACSLIDEVGFPVFNIDLIYGAQGQTLSNWDYSLRHALRASPGELYLYPLYIRELTGLGKRGKSPDEHRLELYEHARELLLSEGYVQKSMRLFRRASLPKSEQTDYCCQEDGMIGLGPGARSYTQGLHYSSEYAVGQVGVREIIENFNNRTDVAFGLADYGAILDLGEQRRRYLIKSILRVSGLNLKAYSVRFGTDVLSDFWEIEELEECGFAQINSGVLKLTAKGIGMSDIIGPWLYSEKVIEDMKSCELV